MPDPVMRDLHLNVRSTGTGRPVVLIHGWPLSGEAWDKQVPDLVAAGYRVITYDRRGFGHADHPSDGFDYDTLTSDLAKILEGEDLKNVTLVGFSMGGGEVARYISLYGEERLNSVVLAAAVPPLMMQSADNPEGPLTQAKAQEMEAGLKADRAKFFDGFTKAFFSANGVLKVTEAKRQEAIVICQQSDQAAAIGCMKAFATTDFRDDLANISVPTLVLHGDADGVVPFAGSGQRTHRAVGQSELVVISGAPHGMNVSHADEFNAALIKFLNKHS